MSPRGRAVGRGVLLALAAVAYAVLAHLSNSTPGTGALGVALALGPLLACAAYLAWRSGARAAAALGTALGALAVYRFWPLLAAHYPWVYLLQQAGAYAVLALTFGRSLAVGRTPLCTRWASRVHGPLPAHAARYTRRVTLVWALFFALITVALLALFALAELPVWSAFANFGVFPLVIALFIIEYRVRGRALPDLEPAGILAGARAFLGSGQEAAAARRG